MCREENKVGLRARYTRRSFGIRVNNNMRAESLSISRVDADSFSMTRCKRSRVGSRNEILMSDKSYFIISEPVSTFLKISQLTGSGGWGNNSVLQSDHGLDQAHKAWSALADISFIVAKDAANRRHFSGRTNMAIDAIALSVRLVQC